MKPLHSLLVLAATCAAGSPALASELTLDGGPSAKTMVGDAIDVRVTGPAGAHVFLLLDVAPGALPVGDIVLPLAGTPAIKVYDLGNLGVTGELAFVAPVPNDPTLAGAKVWLAAVTQTVGQTDVTSAARVTIVDRVAELAGNPIAQYPFFEFVDVFNQGAPISFAIDPARYPVVVGKTADVYVVAAKSKADWISNPTLIDVSASGAEAITFGATIQSNTMTIDRGSLSADGGLALGVGYDVVVDLDRDGLLDGHDLIDGYGGRGGAVVVPDVSLPGPLAVTEVLYSGGSFLGEDTYFPTNIASMGQLPIVVVSHGNGHNYQWYDHIGNHLASWGYVVMSHQNNTQPGIETASTTTLTNTEFLIANQATIAGGALLGHLDTTRIAWIGHSRGGEGVVRAYDRIIDGSYVPVNFTASSIRLISSMAPTNFLGPASGDPHEVNYHLWVGEADNDVSGCANNDGTQSFQILNRSRGTHMSTSLHGAGHGDFHDGGGSSVAAGPCQIGRPTTHQIMKGYLLPLVKAFIDDDPVAREFLWRQYESFHPIGAPVANPCVVVDLQYRKPNAPAFVVDDFQSNAATNVSSSGSPVTLSVLAVTEGKLNDGNTSFTDLAADPMNGMTQAGDADDAAGLVFSFDGATDYGARFDVPPSARDATEREWLSLRAAQCTRTVLTNAALGDVVFDVSLRDTFGHQSTIRIDAFGGGVEEPYQRANCGGGVGWGNEFETIRIRLSDFTTNGNDLDLRALEAVLLDFGPSHGSAQGRLGLDEIEFAAK